MKAFHGKARREALAKGYDERAHPTRGRTAAESMRIMRNCRRFADNVLYVMDDLLQGEAVEWFDIRSAITDRDDEAIIDWRGVAENFKADGYATDDDGLLVNMQDHKLTASNRIEAVTIYVDRFADLEQRYMLRKTVYSPFPCDTWGRLPLTMNQWAEIALPLIRSRALWQWQHALDLYAASNGVKLLEGFQFYSIVGWNLVLTKRVPAEQMEQVETWTGPIIYTLSATTSLRPK